MTREAVMMYAIRLPTGWWRRGAGARPGGPTRSLKWATLYRNKGAAASAAVLADIDEKHGGYEVVETPVVVGSVVLRSDEGTKIANT